MHDVKRYFCVPCGGAGRCACGKYKSKCKECGGGAYCAAHRKLRTRCAECGGGTRCRHGLARRDCDECKREKRPAEEEADADVDEQDVPEPLIVPRRPAGAAAAAEPEPEPEAVAEPVAAEAESDDDPLASKPVKKRRSGQKRIAESVDAADVQAMQ